MTRQLLTGNAAAAWGARLACVAYIPAFPITPQTEIIETLARWTDEGSFPARMVTMDSEHSMVTAAGAAAATGVRTFTATSSQGLLYAMEMLYTVAGWRSPFVLVNVSRGLASPITLEADHNDIMAARDCGMLQIHCATCQEVLDNVLIAYRLGESKRVRLPIIVNLDGFYLSFTREPVTLPSAETAAAFVGEYTSTERGMRARRPASQAVAVLGGSLYSYFRYEGQLAAEAAQHEYEAIAAEFEQHFGRRYKTVETYRIDGAEYAFVMMGSFATKAQTAVDELRTQGHKVGLVRPRLFRPFPQSTLRRVLEGLRGIAVVDQNISMGSGGVLATELAAYLYPSANRPVVASFIGGLGGRDIPQHEFKAMLGELERAVHHGHTPTQRLLFNEDELREVRKMQAIAHAERVELRSEFEQSNQ